MSTKTTSFEQHLPEMFELYDDDGSGGIDQHELRALMAQLGVDLTDEELSAIAMGREEAAAEKGGPSKKRFDYGGIFDDAKQLMSFTSIFRFVTWLYSERKMILLASSHFVATM
eukprot:scaffold45051_cov256-Skeletonema_marinoi.AAC.1